MINKMTFNEFMTRLDTLKTTLLSMPEELTLTAAFQEEQDKLSNLLNHLIDLTPDEQTQARARMQEFANQLNDKLANLQERYEFLRKNIDNTQLRLKGMKAYAKGRLS